MALLTKVFHELFSDEPAAANHHNLQNESPGLSPASRVRVFDRRETEIKAISRLPCKCVIIVLTHIFSKTRLGPDHLILRGPVQLSFRPDWKDRRRRNSGHEKRTSF